MKPEMQDLLTQVLDLVDKHDSPTMRIALSSAVLEHLVPALRELIGYIPAREDAEEDAKVKSLLAISGLGTGMLVRLLMKKEDIAKRLGEGSPFSKGMLEAFKKFCEETQNKADDDSGPTISGAV